MSGSELDNPYRISKVRLETLVDTIFAFAMTLLVLGIVMPELSANQAATELPPYLAKLLPQFILFIIAFLVLAFFWIEHHRQFHYLQIVNPAILQFNVAILIFIVLIPFTTDVSGAYDSVLAAVLLFHVNLLIVGALFLGQWMYIYKRSNLRCTKSDIAMGENRTRILITVPSVAIFGIAVALISPPFSLLAYLLVPVIFAVIGKPPGSQEQQNM